MKNKILSLVLTLLVAFSMCLPAYADTATATIKAVASDCTVNRPITVSIQISDAEDVCGGSLEILYDNSALELVDATKGSIIPEESSNLNKNYTDYSVKLNWMSGQDAISDGEILSLVFNTKLTGKATVSLDNIKLSKFDETPVSCTAIDAEFDIYPECESITISGPDKISVQTTYSAICEPTGFPSKFIQWSIETDAIAVITDNGSVIPYTDGTITITAEATDGTGVKATKAIYADVVLCEAFEIDDESTKDTAIVWCPENGITTVDIAFAAYDEFGKMLAFKPYTTDLKEGKNTVPATDFDYSGARKVKIFMWDSISKTMPLCDAKEVGVSLSSQSLAVVTEVSYVGSSSGTVLTQLTFFKNGESYKYPIDENCQDLSDIWFGDVFQYSLSNGKIVSGIKIADYDQDTKTISGVDGLNTENVSYVVGKTIDKGDRTVILDDKIEYPFAENSKIGTIANFDTRRNGNLAVRDLLNISSLKKSGTSYTYMVVLRLEDNVVVDAIQYQIENAIEA